MLIITNDGKGSIVEFTFRIIKGKNDKSNITIYLNNCLEGMRNCLKKNSIDIVVTSPYNIGINYNTYEDTLPIEKYLAWLKIIGLEIKPVLKNGGSFFLNVSTHLKDYWIARDMANTMREDFVLQNIILWGKSIVTNKHDVGKYENMIGDIAVGHFKPIVNNRFLTDCYEYIFHFTKEENTTLDKLSVGFTYQDKQTLKDGNQ